MRVLELVPGTWVDLEGDPIADDGTHPEFEFEGERVALVYKETPNCFVVEFESGFVCGFPPGHELKTWID